MSRKKSPAPEIAPEDAAPERARDPQRTRNRLLDAAEEELAARGFHGARVRAIVEAAGVNERMLYHYFGDKEGLYRAVIERALTTIAADIGAKLQGADMADIPALVEGILRAFGDTAILRPAFARLILHEALNDFRSFPKLQAEPGDELMAHLVPPMIAAGERGELRRGVDPRAAFTMGVLLFLVWPIAIPRAQRLFPDRDLGTPESLAWAKDQIAAVILHGFLGDEAPARKKAREPAQKKR